MIELSDEVVVELDKNFTPGHDHMVTPMVRSLSLSDPSRMVPVIPRESAAA